MRSKTKSYSGGFGKWLHLGMSSPKDTDLVAPNNDTADLRAAQTQLSVIHPPTDD